MSEIRNKKQLAMLLAGVKTFSEQSAKLEQYPTDAEITADALWFAFMQGDVEGRIIADLGCGHGIFGLGALALGAKKVFFVDIDAKVIAIAKENLKLIEKQIGRKMKAEFLNMNVSDFKKKADVVIQNPPFGVKTTHMDKLFLIKAMETAPVIYTFHKLSTRQFVEKFSADSGYKVDNLLSYRFPLKKTYWFHIKRVHYVDVGCWKLSRK